MSMKIKILIIQINMTSIIKKIPKENKKKIYDFIPSINKKNVNKESYSNYLDLYYPEDYSDWIDITDFFKNNQEKIAILNIYFYISEYRDSIHNIYKEIKNQNLENAFTGNFCKSSDLLKTYEIINNKIKKKYNEDLETNYSLLPHERFLYEIFTNIFQKKNLHKYLIHPEKRKYKNVNQNKKINNDKWYDYLYCCYILYPDIKNINLKQFYFMIIKFKIIIYTNNFVHHFLPDNFKTIIYNFFEKEKNVFFKYLFQNNLFSLMKQLFLYISIIFYIIMVYLIHCFIIVLNF